MVASRAVELGLEVGLHRVVLEGDSEVELKALDRGDEDIMQFISSTQNNLS